MTDSNEGMTLLHIFKHVHPNFLQISYTSGLKTSSLTYDSVSIYTNNSKGSPKDLSSLPFASCWVMDPEL